MILAAAAALCLTSASFVSSASDSHKGCTGRFNCLEYDISSSLEQLSRSPPLDIFPGVSISSRGLPKQYYNGSKLRNGTRLSGIFGEYLRSLTLHVSLYNEDALNYVDRHQGLETGRGKKSKFLSIYTIFAMAFALLSTLVGKAMTLSIVSLVMAMITRNAIGNSPPASPVAYDIVRRPQVNVASETFWAAAGSQDPQQDPEPPFPNPFIEQPPLYQYATAPQQ